MIQISYHKRVYSTEAFSKSEMKEEKGIIKINLKKYKNFMQPKPTTGISTQLPAQIIGLNHKTFRKGSNGPRLDIKAN